MNCRLLQVLKSDFGASKVIVEEAVDAVVSPVVRGPAVVGGSAQHNPSQVFRNTYLGGA